MPIDKSNVINIYFLIILSLPKSNHHPTIKKTQVCVELMDFVLIRSVRDRDVHMF